MGFSFVSIKFTKSLKLTLLLLSRLFRCFMFIVMPVLNHLALFKPQQQHQQQQEHECSQTDHVLVMVGYSFISVPIQTMISFVKKSLPVVEYGEFLQRSATKTTLKCLEEEKMECCVCLDNLVKSDLVRELPNCCHVFHQHCLDCWVHEGQVTCPICRSMLFPTKSFSYNHLLHHD